MSAPSSKDYRIGICPFRKASAATYCSALQQVFKEESLTFLGLVHEFGNLDCASRYPFIPFLGFALLEYCDSVSMIIEWVVALTPQSILN